MAGGLKACHMVLGLHYDFFFIGGICTNVELVANISKRSNFKDLSKVGPKDLKPLHSVFEPMLTTDIKAGELWRGSEGGCRGEPSNGVR